MKNCRAFSLLFSLFALLHLTVMAAEELVPKIIKIDPPNWWAGMPKPFLLVRGEHLTDAHFTLSDPHLRIDKAKFSANGHWAELWLNASPSRPETITLRARNTSGQSTRQYRFEQKRPTTNSFAGFSSRDAMYLIMTDRFADGDLANDGPDGNEPESSAEAAAQRVDPRGWHGGDLRGITQHLDYIQRLGFTTLWITPVYDNEQQSNSYHGYGATDLYAVDPHFGSLTDLQALAAELHRRHMKLVLDTVPNHIGQNHPWIDDPPDPDWLHGTRANHHEPLGEFTKLVDPQAPERDKKYILDGWFANVLADLNQENPATAQYLIQNAMWWIEQTGADGLRIDTFPYVGRSFWHDFHAQLHTTFPSVTTVGEVFNCDATITSAFAGGVMRNGQDTGLDTPFDFPSYCALRDVFLKDAPMSHLADVWRLDALYPHPDRLIAFLGNHDTSRFISTEGATPDKMQLAFAVLLTMRGMPQIYSGDEIAMTGGDDPENRHDFPGGWPGTTRNAFTHPTQHQAAMQDWVQQLLALRAKYPALQTGSMQVLNADKDTLACARVLPATSNNRAEKIIVVVNRASFASLINIKLAGTALAGTREAQGLFGRANVDWTASDATINMPPNSAWIAVVR